MARDPEQPPVVLRPALLRGLFLHVLENLWPLVFGAALFLLGAGIAASTGIQAGVTPEAGQSGSFGQGLSDLSRGFAETMPAVAEFAWLPGAVVLVFWLSGFVRTALLLGAHRAEIRGSSLYIVAGLISRSEHSVRLESIASCQMTQTLLQRLAGVANVKVATGAGEWSAMIAGLPRAVALGVVQNLGGHRAAR